jgi:hypothetical protein
MRRGYNGYSSRCCEPFEVWGFSSDCPNLHTLQESTPGSVHLWKGYPSEVGTPSYSTSATWYIKAAKVPSSYPYCHCDTKPPLASNDPNAEHQWEGSLATLATIKPFDGNARSTDVHFVVSSRAVYIDGYQKYINYSITSILPGQEDDTSIENEVPTNTDVHQDTVQINIDTQASAGTFLTEYLGFTAFHFDTDPGNPEFMHYYYRGMKFLPDLQIDFYGRDSPTDDGIHGDRAWGIAANCVYRGKDYYFASTYNPTNDYSGVGWTVARVQYTGHPDNPNNPICYCSDDKVGMSNTGPYSIVLPSCRGYLLTTVSQPDEPWVCALSTSATPKLVTGRALNTGIRILDSTFGDGPATVWDGSLLEDEVENIICEGDEWRGIRVRSYNHINGKDYLYFTTTSYKYRSNKSLSSCRF